MMQPMKREITKEQYNRAVENHRILTAIDRETVFSVCERYGYGVYGGSVSEDGGKYYVHFSLGSTCD